MTVFWSCYGTYTGRRTLSVFLPYFYNRLAEHSKEVAYRAYVTDSLRIIATNTGGSASALGAHGSEIKARYMELIKRKQETRTAEEIINHISEGLRKVGEA